MYDPIRRIVAEYFATGRAEGVLTRCAQTFERKTFGDPDFAQRYVKSNRSALAHLRDLDIPGAFRNARSKRTSVVVGKLEILSTADFFAQYMRTAANGKERDVAVIVNPSGTKKRLPEQRKLWAGIESEVAFRAAAADGISVDEVIFVDLPRKEIHRFKGPKSRLWAEIDATCERIYRDWRDIRLEAEGYGEERA
jgi:hypothetical protein